MLTRKQWEQVEKFDREYRDGMSCHAGMLSNGASRSGTIRYQLLEARADGNVCVVTVAVQRKLRGYNGEYQEVFVKDVARKIPGKKSFKVRGLVCRGIAGWYVADWSPFEEWGSVDWEWHGVLRGEGERVINPEVLEETKFKYCAWKESSGIPLADYLNLYLKEPKVEFLAKAGLWNLVSPNGMRVLGKDKQFFAWVRENLEEIARTPDFVAGFRELMWACKHGKKITDAVNHFEVQEEIRRMGGLPEEIRDKKEVILQHIEKLKLDANRYARYLTDAKTAGWNLTDEHVYLAPKKTFNRRSEEAEAERARVVRMRDRKDHRRAALKMKRTLDGTRLNGFRKDGFEAHLSTYRDVFEKEGRKMRNCIGSMGYFEKQLRGESLIVFVRKNGRRFADVELGLPDCNVLQVYEAGDAPAKKPTQDFAKRCSRRARRCLARILRGRKETAEKTGKEDVA